MVDATQEIVRGLAGILVTESSMSSVNGEKGILTYRGYDIHDLAEHSTFEEVTYLLFNGELPTSSQLRTFRKEMNSARDIPDTILQMLRALPREAHPMAHLRTAVSAYGCLVPDADEVDVEHFNHQGAKLVSQIATIAAADWRTIQGQDPVRPDPELGYAANFLYMMNGIKPTSEEARIMDKALICHADHGIPASTFSAMVVVSSMTDLFSAVTAAIGSLKGPLHGGANEQVLINLDKIGSKDKVAAYVEKVQKEKIKVMGFGHRVYKTWDPRAVIFKKMAEERAKIDPALAKTYSTALELETKFLELYAEKGLYPNVDYYSGIIYRSLGIDAKMFTPIFAIARTAGWVARLIEYLPQNRIFRPKGKYVGKTLRDFVPLSDRK